MAIHSYKQPLKRAVMCRSQIKIPLLGLDCCHISAPQNSGVSEHQKVEIFMWPVERAWPTFSNLFRRLYALCVVKIAGKGATVLVFRNIVCPAAFVRDGGPAGLFFQF